MKVKEILEMTLTKPVAEIAKDHLTIGEKKLRDALKEIGCEHQKGKKGWSYSGDQPELLDKSIYDFVPPTRRKAKAINKTISNASNEIAVASEKQALVKASRKPVGSELDSIDRLLMQNQKESNERTYRGFYWDKDIIEFLDSVKHGNKSDLMNEIVRAVLKAKGLI